MYASKSLITTLMLLFGSQALQACPNCFGAKGDPVVESIGWAILFLLVLVLATVGGVIAFFVNVARRTRQLEQQAS